jgi:ATPase subunit of ABC transporter with duplicated ATPase domains
MAQESKTASKRQKTLERELDWVRQGAKGRQTKQKARLNNYDKLMSQDQKLLDEKLEIYIPNGPRLGTNVIEAKGVSKAFGDKLLYENLEFNLPQAGIVGIIGPNGAGKTTLFNMISGTEKNSSGSIRFGDTVKLGYVDQSREELSDDQTVWEEISEGLDEVELGHRTMQSRAYVSQFNFKGPDQQKKVGQLSGGERNRVHLAKVMKSGANVILLDEPTNDLDVDTLRALEEALLAFPGCILITSHDRWFLDRIATHIIAFEGDSQVIWFEGNYGDYEADRQSRLGALADQPHRIKYRPLVKG